MCGICGLIGIENPCDSEPIVRRMMAAIEHRGPDDEGLLAAPDAALGMRRLSIIDLPGGGQPVWNEAGTCAVIYNGEIYNFRELRRELESLGHQFQTHSDTEVIVHAYEAWGEDCVARLRGMFAFAIAEMPAGRDGPVTRVFLARDRFGIKPLYYAIVGGKFLFASEVRALLVSGKIARKISPTSLASYVLFGSVGEPETLLEGVHSLPPGHRMMVSTRNPSAPSEPEPYWNLDASRAAWRHENRAPKLEPPQLLRSLLEDSVRRHLVADVPIGVFLSSGIDSTALTALASQERAGIHTFTLVFPEREFSEAEIARRTARRFKTDHQELSISGEEMLARLDEAVGAFDQPSMDGINTYFVSWAARQAGLKVALSGLGSDEIFGGYSTFQTAPRLARISTLARAIPHGLRRATAPIFEFMGGRLSHADAGRKLAGAWMNPVSLPDAYFLARSLFSPTDAGELLAERNQLRQDSSSRKWLRRAADEAQTLEGASSISWLELRSYLVNTLLRDTDAMSMRHSLEVRVPFLDHPVVEYALGLSDREKLLANRPKGLLIAALRDLLPEEIVAQRKRTFTLPWAEWLRGALRARVAAGFGDWSPLLDAVLPRSAAQAVWSDFLDGRRSWSRPWSLYVLNEWIKRNLESSLPSAAPVPQAARSVPAPLA
ncbi:MAG: asparagine synthase (glutamine-hydrolyzing) [Candidatus Acidiferrales bacterium]